MLEQILDNEIYKILIKFAVLILPFVISSIHFKKYNFIQGILTFLTLPIIILGILEIILIKDFDPRFVSFLNSIGDLFRPLLELHRSLYKLTTWEWLYNSGWIYVPSFILFILSWGFSITARKKKKKKEKQSNQ